MDWFSRNWLALLGLVAAIVAAIPGVLALVELKRSKPGFTFALGGFTTGHMVTKDHQVTFMLLVGSVGNSGKLPLSPMHYDLEIRLNGVWHQFQRHLLPPGVTFEGADGNTQGAATGKDLATFAGSIPPGHPLHGLLLFVSPTLPLQVLKAHQQTGKMGLRLKCTDIFEKEYVHDVVLHQLSPMGANFELPQQGFRTQSKPQS